MAPVIADADRVPPIVELFVRQLLVANKAVSLYPPSSTIPRETSEETVRLLSDVLERYAEVTLTVTRQGLYFDDKLVFPNQPAFAAFAVGLYHRRLSAVRFHAGVTYRDILSFLTILKVTPEDLAAGGGFEAQLWDQGVGAITVVETQVMVVDSPQDLTPPGEVPEEEPAPEDEWRLKRPPVAPPRMRERIEIAHLVGDPVAAREYLRASSDSEGLRLGLPGTARRFSAVARLVSEVDASEGASLVHSLAAALWELDPDLRREVLVERVLPEARYSGPLAEAVRQLDLEDVCRMLAAGADTDDARREGLARALRNLSQVSKTDQAGFVEAADGALLAAGLDTSQAEAVLTRAFPRRLAVRQTQSLASALGPSAAAVLQLIEEAPVEQARREGDPEVAALADEAERGVSDGQVIDSLVTLLTLDVRDTEFASTMSALEDQLGVLVVRGEIDTAADAALSLFAAAKNPGLSVEQRRRLEQSVQRFARPEDMRAITQALWLFKPGEPEHVAARRLLEALGPIAIPAILEQLADEPDRTIRKALVDLLSNDAVHYVPEIGSHISDARWYFVRNVVAILGSTRLPSVLTYLERTIRHHDARVRRETIRALSSVGDRRSMELVTVALADEDAQNVQLAARYLGLRADRAARPALEAVARGESRGNRDTGPRVEAIEALGRIGDPDALPALRTLANKRSLLGSARYREIRAAATSAIGAIRRADQGSVGL